ncbi:Cell pattern formation-associated protein [Wickerhamomyces ciferrii]|uniref:Cell pattern formation-associated protein n=1 Tax=Wickerhamomyces ciferrii (strain ATCC 14091 / BCRC 22168 / CBS 111 / JCM 3599 / NBRC 0793 / NRRL Y-1031 F-60-10) TaxID=1206466 RepID=K0KXK1_WICCF|nr:Cell pattern formation-associated protein [Wickerhamomyces ciferrii]CCH46757.1 Cell pattern formation-associated protein [Wickerhamomyces ciferrii]
MNNNFVGASTTAPGMNNYSQPYNTYQQSRPQPGQPSQQQSPNQQQAVAQTGAQQQGINRATAPYYNQYDQQQQLGQQQQLYGANYGQPGLQQYQQQPNYYQQTSGTSTGQQPQSNLNQYGVPQYNQSFVNSYNQGVPGYQAATTASYGYPGSYPAQQQVGTAQFNPNDTNSPYKANTQVNPSVQTSGSNINMANIRGGLQSATAPPLIDPNQVPQRPKLTTTYWEDENTVCYQVESRGISVSRREDTNFINGTKLLNVAGMTRGRRDGILKSEKVRYVVKIGAMNLKGVWIPFERALELARNEGIVDLLYPLFVKDIKELYQGPQYSGGLTAAANSNPKNIVPVQVTNTTYTPSAYATREKKLNQTSTPKAEDDKKSQTQQTPNITSTATANPTIGATSTNPNQYPTATSQPQQLPYGAYSGATAYPYSNQYSYAQPQAGAIVDPSGASSAQPYPQGAGYYGYQQPVGQTDGSVPASNLDSDKKVDGEDKK